MKKYISSLLLTVSIYLLSAVELNAQSEAFAGGEIVVDYAGDGSENCGGPVDYLVTLKFYRDCLPPSNPLPGSKTIGVRYKHPSDPNQTIAFFADLDNFQSRGIIDNRCLQTDPACTEGAWYSGIVTIPEPHDRWEIFYGVLNAPNGLIAGRPLQSPDNDNIQQAQTFFLKTIIDNSCGDVETDPNRSTSIPAPGIKKNNVWKNTQPKWLVNDIVETFCGGKSYNYRLKSFVQDVDQFTVLLNENNPSEGTEVITDELEFDLVSTFRADNAGTIYEPGFSSQNPFPSTPLVRFDRKNAILSFTPDLNPLDPSFVAVVTFRVREYRERYVVDTRCLTATCPNSSDSTDILTKERYLISQSLRQLRFVFDNQCNKRLPVFSSDVRNDVEQAWEFPCASKTLDFTMSEPMLCQDALNDPKWLSMYRGKPGSPLDDDGVGIDEIEILDCNAIGEFTRFRVHLYVPEEGPDEDKGIGPGNYTLFPKPNKSQNGIFNRCGFELEEGSVEIPVYINEDDFDFIFKDGDKPVRFCDPADDPFTLNALQGQNNFGGDLFTFRYTQNDPNAVRDSSSTKEYVIDVPVDVNGDKDYPEGFWKVGVGFDYGYTYNGQRFEAFCYDEDEIVVEFLTNPPLEIPDYDLCENEPWPVIDIDSMTTKHNAQSYQWDYLRTGTSTGPGGDWVTTGGASGGPGKKNDTLDVASVGFGLGKPFTIRSIVEHPNSCLDTNIFTVLKQKVLVKIEPPSDFDTTICPGAQYMLRNVLEPYLVPDSMSYEWFLDGELLSDADSSSLMITKEGEYKLVVTKNTVNTMCSGEYTVIVNIADSLVEPDPNCVNVSWVDDDVQQRFYTTPVEGADGYQVREINELGNKGDWKEISDGLAHLTRGKQVTVEMRGYNTEVPEESPCRFGPIGFAEACNVVVKPTNIFTPNGDGVNETLRFDLLEVYPGSPLQIFNRWGKLIYETNDYRNDWNGEDYKDGTYFYILDINDESQDLLKGTFTIVR